MCPLCRSAGGFPRNLGPVVRAGVRGRTRCLSGVFPLCVFLHIERALGCGVCVCFGAVQRASCSDFKLVTCVCVYGEVIDITSVSSAAWRLCLLYTLSFSILPRTSKAQGLTLKNRGISLEFQQFPYPCTNFKLGVRWC